MAAGSRNSKQRGFGASSQSATAPCAWFSSHRSTEARKNPDFFFAIARSGASPRAAVRSAFPDQSAHLVPRRNAGRELDQMMVEKRHPNLERVRHGSTVEVMVHVVRKRELRVQEQGLAQRIRREPVDSELLNNMKHTIEAA